MSLSHPPARGARDLRSRGRGAFSPGQLRWLREALSVPPGGSEWADRVFPGREAEQVWILSFLELSWFPVPYE